jgi:predicted ABC-type ATPase
VPDPVLHLIAGPNGAGKSTFYDLVIEPATHLEFVNADLIAARKWRGNAGGHAYDAADLATARRTKLIAAGKSFATETVFSHESKVDLTREAIAAGYLVTLHVIAVPEKLAVARVANRADNGGHAVPEGTIRDRYRRLWPLIATAIEIVDTAVVYDNTSARKPFRVVARLKNGKPLMAPTWPTWAPLALKATAPTRRRSGHRET